MSRSAQQGFNQWLNNMRVPRQPVDAEATAIPILRGYSAVQFISDEQFYLLRAESDSRYERTSTKTVVASTNEDWAKYHLAKRALLTLNAYENTTGAEEVEVPCPKPKTVLNFTETHDEWIERCHQMYQAERQAA
jgi:hypothetical protein